MKEGKKGRGSLFWELVALASIVIAFSPLLMPVLDGVIMGARLEDGVQVVVVRMSIAESGGFQPSVIRVEAGRPVKLVLMSMDTTHSLVIPELGIDSGPIDPGKIATVVFTPTEPGIYELYCGRVCSYAHHFMLGELVVEGG